MNRFQVLIVDDDVDFAESMGEVLQARGYEVTLAFNGEEGLARVTERAYGTVLLDMKMPGMTGLECLAALRRVRPGIRVLMVTAFTKSNAIRQAMEMGAVTVLPKPVRVEELLETISFLPAFGSILLVEDDEDLAEAMGEALIEAGFSVAVVPSLAAARERLAQDDIQLLILDFLLPDGTGPDLLEWLNPQERAMGVVVVTGYPDQAFDRLPYISARDILVKPFEPLELLEAVGQLHCLARGAG